MRLFFYTTRADRRLKWLEQRLSRLRPLCIEYHPDIDSLGRGLRQSGGELTLVVLLTTNQEELQEVQTLRPLLNDKPLILILPDRSKDTIAKGHVLAPRFLTDVQSDFREVYEVLSKMLKKYSYNWQQH